MLLTACPSCSRQYDVRHLHPNARVRCACDVVFDTGEARGRRVEALHCSHCGGAVEPEAAACGYCGAAVPESERRSSVCPHCFTRVPEGARHCGGCGVEIAPQALTPIPEGRRCPRCSGALRVRSLELVSVVECSACEGLWLSRESFERVVNEARLGQRVGPPATPAAPEASGAVTYIRCVACRQPMMPRQHRHRGLSSHVLVDVCGDHGVWLDAGELERIVAFVRPRDGALTGPESAVGPALFPEGSQLATPAPGPVRSRREKAADGPGAALGDVVRFLGELLGDILF